MFILQNQHFIQVIRYIHKYLTALENKIPKIPFVSSLQEDKTQSLSQHQYLVFLFYD